MANITVDIKKKSIEIGSNLVAIGKWWMNPWVYDPQEIKADAFDMDNMVDWIDKHYLTTEQIEEFEGKQDALTAWDNIDITNNVISATDTTYTAWEWISIDENNVISNTRISAEWWNIEWDIEDQTDLQNALDEKQDVLTAWNNVQIEDNVISATDTTYTAGEWISIDSNNVISNTQTSAEWWNIEWDIEDQTDLKAALDSKQNTISDLSQIRSNATAGKNASDTITTYWDIVTHDVDEFITSDAIGEWVLTIQKNSTTVDTFSANAKTDKTINITVPTQASDIGALPDTTKYAANLDLSINSSTYVITAQLKDQDWNNLWTQRTIDLPLESVVVDWEYDTENKKIILTLENGNKIEFSVADLVNWLQTEITVDNKLDADLVDDSTATNKFVSSSEKSTWDAKQDAISDLSTIRSGAAAWATAVQPWDNISTLTDDVWYQTVDNMVATLVWADNSHYPTAKAVSDAISSSWAGDMVASVYDPNSVESDAFDMDNMNDGINKHYISTAQQTVLNNTSWINTWDQSATDFDIKDLADSTWLRTEWGGKQDKLIAGSNIQIAADGKTISATDTTYTAWTGIDITNWVISNTQTSAEWWNIQWDIEDQTDLQNALSGKQDTISDLATIRNNATAWAWAATTIAWYWDIVSHDADEFATAAQWTKADTALQSWDNISELSNDTWYVTSSYHDNSKQDVINDLVTIRSWAELWATAIQPNDNISELTNDVWYITSSYHDSTKQDVISDLGSIRAGASAWATALQNWDLKTVNGNSLVWSGNIEILGWIQNDTTWTTDTIEAFWSGTKDEFDNLTKDSDKYYIVTDVGSPAAVVTSVNWNTWAVTVAEFEPDNAGSTDQVLTKTASWYEWANAAWSDYSWVTKTISGWEVELGLRTIVDTPESDFTLTAPTTLKDWEEYAIRIISETSYTMTLWTWFTNPRNVDTTLSGNATDQYVFLAIWGELELQPLVDTWA